MIATGLSPFQPLLRALLNLLLDEEGWQALAREPAEFDQKMQWILDSVRGFMRARYGLNAHRPTRHAVRDARIYILKTRGEKFPEIAKRLDISPSTAHRAYDRQETRAHRFVEFMAKVVHVAKTQPELVAGPNGEVRDLSAFANLFD